MASIHPLTDASALGHLLVVVLVDRLERRPLEKDRSLACVPGQCREIVDADVDGGVSSIVLFLLDLWNLIDEFQIDFPAMRDDACLLEHSIWLTREDGLYRDSFIQIVLCDTFKFFNLTITFFYQISIF